MCKPIKQRFEWKLCSNKSRLTELDQNCFHFFTSTIVQHSHVTSHTFLHGLRGAEASQLLTQGGGLCNFVFAT